MSQLSKLIAAHPLAGNPYDKLHYVAHNGQQVPLYRVDGCGEESSGALDALKRAFERYGGQCFYCGTAMRPGKLAAGGPHRDHVVARCREGKDLLHNLVIACGACGGAKGQERIEEFRPSAAGAYLEALNRHLARCVKREFGRDS